MNDGSYVWRLAILLAVVLLSDQPLAAQTLDERLTPLIDAHEGKCAVFVRHLQTGEKFEKNPDQPMPTASLIKVAVMVEAYCQADEGKVDLGKMVTLRDEDKVPGSGILTPHFSAGAQISLRDAIRLMIAYSDNTATNLVLDQIGLAAPSARMEKLGLTNTKIHSKVFRRDTSVFPERSKQFGLGSTTAAEIATLFELIHRKKAASEKSCEAMLEHLRACDDEKSLAASLPKGTKLAHKTGAVNAVRCDAGIMTTKGGPVVIVVLTSENKDQSWSRDNAACQLAAKIGRAVYDHFEKLPQTQDHVGSK
jgi:beta-lactamase class A